MISRNYPNYPTSLITVTTKINLEDRSEIIEQALVDSGSTTSVITKKLLPTNFKSYHPTNTTTYLVGDQTLNFDKCLMNSQIKFFIDHETLGLKEKYNLPKILVHESNNKEFIV